MKKLILILMIIALAACAANEVVVKTAAEMVAEEIGIAVAQNNKDLINKVLPYYSAMKGVTDKDELASMMQYGIQYILSQYAGDDLTSKRIASKVSRLLEMSGFNPAALEVPEMGSLSVDYMMGIADAFVGGMQMVNT